MTPDRNHLIGSVAGTLRLVEILGQAPGPLPLKALAQATGRPKSTLHRMLSTLVSLGFVAQDEANGAYRLTMKLWQCGMSALAELDILKVSRNHLETLMQATDETVHLAVLDANSDIVYISKVESPRSIRVQTQLGRRTPSWCTATGRALIAFLPEVRDKVLSKPLTPRTAATVTDPTRLKRILEKVAAQGYAVTKAENHPEMGGIAAPIRDHSGEVCASCGVAIPVFRMDQKLVKRCVPMVLKAAAAISAEFGYQPHRRVKYAT